MTNELLTSSGDYSYTIPVLFDKKMKQIGAIFLLNNFDSLALLYALQVNNESSEIIRIFNNWHGESDKDTPELYPESIRQDIDELNSWVYDTVNK